jgi:hypothetical protein
MKNGTMDMYGNPKIPWLRTDLEKDADGWMDLSKLAITEGSYSSLIGVPIDRLQNRNSTFVVETTYMALDCQKPQNETLVNIDTNTTTLLHPNGTFYGPNTTAYNGIENGIYPSWEVAMDQFVSNAYFYGYPEQLVNISASDAPPQATFLFQTRGPWVSRCKINQVYVESAISCQSIRDSQIPQCAVKAQRPSPKKHAPSTITTFSFPTTFTYMTQQWILATDPLTSSGYSSLTEYYLQNTSANFILSGNGRNYADYTNVTASQFSQRLAQLANTWVLASQVNANLMSYFGMAYQNLTVTYTDTQDVYDVSWPWLAVYCVSIAVMLVAALVSIICSFATTIPDVLSFCSTLTRDSPYFPQAHGGTTLDGTNRARILRDVKVKLGEVVAEDEDKRGLDANGFVNAIPEDKVRQLAIAPPEYVRTPGRGVIYA